MVSMIITMTAIMMTMIHGPGDYYDDYGDDDWDYYDYDDDYAYDDEGWGDYFD